MPFGDPTASAIARQGEPVLLRRWHRPLTHRAPLYSQIERLTLDLRDAGRATVPAAIPLAIGDRVISRNLRGVSVHSVTDGRLLWETDEEFSPERLQSAGSDPFADPALRQAFQMRFQFGPDPSQGLNEYRPLTNTLFHDGVHGLVSSDDRRLYVVENDGANDVGDARLNFNGLNIQAGGTQLGQPLNRLVAYDMKTGRPAWPQFGGLGGDLTDGPFETPLAGYYFFGPPTPVGNELLVVGEAEKQVRLVAIDPESGQPRWIRPIAEAQMGIAQDPIRRLWPAQVAAADGVIVCPTTVGWLVAIEQASRSILWAERHSPPRPGGDANAESSVVSPSSLSNRWGPSAPVIHQGKVFFTPAEDAHVICRDLYNGDLVWQRGKGTSLYLAGVTDELLIIVGVRSVEAVDTETGTTRWSAPLPAGSGAPSGRAVLTADRLYLPLRGESLLTVDLANGKTIEEMPLPPGEGSLGNLLLYRGTLLSLSMDGLTAFEERSELVRAVEEQLQKNPADVEALIRRAQLQHADGQLIAAAETLDRLSGNPVPQNQAERLRTLRWNIFSALVELDAQTHGGRLEELTAMARTSDERFLVRRLDADRHLDASEFVNAAKAYLALLGSDESRILSEDSGRRTIRLDPWLSGRSKDLWDKAEDPARAGIDRLIREAVESASEVEAARFAAVFAFHPAAIELERRLADVDLAAGRFAEAEARLLRLSRHPDGSVAAGALLALASAAQGRGLAGDARHWLDRAASFDPALVLADGKTLGASRDNASPAVLSGETNLWGHFRLNVVRSGGYVAVEQSANLRPSFAELPFFHERSVRLLQPDRMAVSGPDGVGLHQVIPLHVGHRSGTRTLVSADGHVLFVVYRGVLQAISPVEGRVLWSMPMPEDATVRFSQETSVAAMRPAGGLASTAGLVARMRSQGSLAAANASYVAIQGRRDLSVLDPVTGEQRWSRTDLPRGATVVGTESLLYVLPRGGRQGKVLRALDGQDIDLPQAASKLESVVAVVGDRLLLATEEPTLRLLGLRVGGGAALSLYDPFEDEVVWSKTFPPQTLFDLASDGGLRVLTPDDGRLVSFDAATGEASTLGTVPAEALRRRSDVVLLEDADGVYLVVNVGRVGSAFSDLSAISTSGEIFAFDKSSRDLLWRREISGRRMLCEEFAQTPVLLFVDNERTQKGNQNVWQVNLFALDKRTGEPVLDEPHFMTSTPVFRGFSVQPERRSIELTSYNTRLRLQAVPRVSDSSLDEAAATSAASEAN
ncbi:MAG: PQQ-like beta-propeller repeat protein [Planctomycetota bacterium]|nr:PQQ-like beta-propeller repeat protein [Planctomycetota bacterium]